MPDEPLAESPPVIRGARPADAPCLRGLAAQLGYYSDPEEFAAKLAAALESGETAIFVAELHGEAVAWSSVRIVRSFYSHDTAEISGFVVEESLRGRGIGTLLMARMEAWAAGKGMDRLRLRANAVRAEAHSFYEGRGFSRTKVQYVFEKPLNPPGRPVPR